MIQPKITVLMSVLNGEAYLREAIDSVLGQTFADFEFLIVENASTDGTAAILSSYEDERLRVLRNDDVLTLTQSLNKGLAASKGEYIARLDADDIALPERLEKQTRFLDTHPDVALVASACNEFSNAAPFPGISGPLPPGNHDDLMAAMARDSILAHSSIMFRRDTVRGVGGYPADYTYCMDYVLYFRLARAHRLASIPEPLVAIRSHEAQITALPAWGLRREQEAANAFREALSYPELSAPVRQGLKQYLALTSLRLAKLHARNFSPLRSALWLLRSVAGGPRVFYNVVLSAAARRLSRS